MAADVTVLLVEDKPELLEAMAEALGELGVRIGAHGDAGAGLGALPLLGGPTVLVTDAGVGDLPGPTLAEAFRAVRPDGAVVFMAGPLHDCQCDEALPGARRPCDVVLRKPFDGHELREAVSRAAALAPSAVRAKGLNSWGTMPGAAGDSRRIGRKAVFTSFLR